MCENCDPNSYYNEIYYDDIDGWYIEICTTNWNEYYDDFDKERLYINYCPYCGRRLND